MRKALNISMPEEMYDFVVERMHSTYHSSVSEYLRSLIRRDQVESEKPARKTREKTPPPRRANDYFELYRDEIELMKNQDNGN